MDSLFRGCKESIRRRQKERGKMREKGRERETESCLFRTVGSMGEVRESRAAFLSNLLCL